MICRVRIDYFVGKSRYLEHKGTCFFDKLTAEELRDEYLQHAAQLNHLVRSTELEIATRDVKLTVRKQAQE